MVKQQRCAVVQPGQISSATLMAQNLLAEVAGDRILRTEGELNRAIVFSHLEIGGLCPLQDLTF